MDVTTLLALQQLLLSNMTTVMPAWRPPDNLLNGVRYFSEDECFRALGNWVTPPAPPIGPDIYCNATFDTIQCWPAAPAGTVIRQHCPIMAGLDQKKYSSRRCGEDGYWLGNPNPAPGSKPPQNGWTDYYGCYTIQAKEVMSFFSNRTDDDLKFLYTVIYGTRILEIVGLVLSLVSLIVSLFIFTYFRSLKCHRTRIHSHLFVAIILEVLLRLVYYLDQKATYVSSDEKYKNNEDGFTQSNLFMLPCRNLANAGLVRWPLQTWICQFLYAFMEFFKTSKFMWMFIEGMYLHNMIAISVFSRSPNHVLYACVGWGVPVPFIIALSVIMVGNYGSKCWDASYYLSAIWIVEAPRVLVLIVNSVFYINTIRILITKLRNSYTNEEQQVRKALKAALVLLPLLGITNFAVMLEPAREIYAFAAWSFTAHFLQSFQGIFVAVVYCFLNGEVRHTLDKRWQRLQHTTFFGTGRRRMSRSMSVFTSMSEVAQNRFRVSQNSINNGHVTPLMDRSALTDKTRPHPHANGHCDVTSQLMADMTYDGSRRCSDPAIRSVTPVYADATM